MINSIKNKIKKSYSYNNIDFKSNNINSNNNTSNFKIISDDDCINNKIKSFKSNCLNCNKIINSKEKMLNFCDLDCKSSFKIKSYLIEN